MSYQEKFMRNVRSSEIKSLQFAVGIMGNMILGTIFVMFTKKPMHTFLETKLKTILFPIVMCLDILQAIFAWRQSYLNRFKDKGLLSKAILETVAALTVSIAIVGSFIMTSLFVVATPIMFVATLSIKSFYHICFALYEGYQALISKDPVEQPKHLQSAISHGTTGIVLLLDAVAIGLVLLAGKLIFGIIGAVSSLIAVSYYIFEAHKEFKHDQLLQSEHLSEEVDRGTKRTLSPLSDLDHNTSPSIDQSISPPSSLGNLIHRIPAAKTAGPIDSSPFEADSCQKKQQAI